MRTRVHLRRARLERRCHAAGDPGRRRWHGKGRAAVATGTLVIVLGALGLTSSGLSAASPRASSAATSTSSATRRSRTSVTGSRVLVVGDSLTDQSRDSVLAALRTEGWDPVIAAQGGTSIEYWSTRIRDLVAYVRPAAVVVELGTNDCNTTCAGLSTAIDQLLTRISSNVPVFWLNVQEQPTYPTGAPSVNAELRSATNRHSNLSLVDLDARFHSHPEWHAFDGLHFNEAGRQQLGQLIAEALHPVRPTSTVSSHRVAA
jgi:lysophospholipase L1-like esterase